MTASTANRGRVVAGVSGSRVGLRRFDDVAMRRAHNRAPGPRFAPRLRWWREVLVVGITYGIYELSRGIHEGGVGAAMRNGKALLQWEQVWHLDPEATLNAALGHLTWLSVAAAYFYSTMHYLITPAVLIWMYRQHADRYRLVRTALAISTILGLIGFYLLPTAPPRLIPGSGSIDTLNTVSHWGWWSSEGSVPRGLGGLSNQFAAMPSLHVGWALWAGLLIAIFATRMWVRVLGALYPVLTTLVVISTGNHYLVDAFAGVGVMALGTGLAVFLGRYRRQQLPRTDSSPADAEVALAA